MSEVPIIVGVSQLEQRTNDPLESKEPAEMMVDAVTKAAEDAHCRALMSESGSIRVIRGIWPYENPGKFIAERIGNPQAETVITPYGGNFVQTVVNHSALDIRDGNHEIIIITGAECGRSQAKAAATKTDLKWSELKGNPDRSIGEEVEMRGKEESGLGMGRPIQMYPMFENALRHHLQESISDHLQRIAKLWSGFSEVASKNPNAWIKEIKTPEDLMTISRSNRPVSVPYTKLMNSNNSVDQAAALILTSVSKARALGIPESQWIYPWSGTDAHDTYFVSNRDNLYSSPAIRIAGRRCLEIAGLNTSDIDLVDVYSCFPVAVQIAAREIGLDMTKPLTITGGLTFAGGPLNNYVMHSIARMTQLLREKSGKKGFITANGGYLTKHAFGTYSSEPPSATYQHQDVQNEVDKTPSRLAIREYSGKATVESYTMMYGADGSPGIGHVSCLLENGTRTWANCEDKTILEAMTKEEFCGKPVTLSNRIASF